MATLPKERGRGADEPGMRGEAEHGAWGDGPFGKGGGRRGPGGGSGFYVGARGASRWQTRKGAGPWGPFVRYRRSGRGRPLVADGIAKPKNIQQRV
jgi:hypothetical protein